MKKLVLSTVVLLMVGVAAKAADSMNSSTDTEASSCLTQNCNQWSGPLHSASAEDPPKDVKIALAGTTPDKETPNQKQKGDR